MPAPRPSIWEKVKHVAPCPFDQYLIAEITWRPPTGRLDHDGHEVMKRTAIAPMMPRSGVPDWQNIPWVFLDTGEPVGPECKFGTYGRLLERFARSHPKDVIDCEARFVVNLPAAFCNLDRFETVSCRSSARTTCRGVTIQNWPSGDFHWTLFRRPDHYRPTGKSFARLSPL